LNVRYTPELEPGTLGVRPGCKVVPVRDPKNLRHLDRALREAEREDVDVVVPTVKVERELVATGSNPNFTPDEQAIFTAVVDLAEKHGKSVVPLVLTSNDAFFAVARTARELGRTGGTPMRRVRAGTRRASRRGVDDPRVAYLLYGTLAAAYGLSVWAIIRQRRRGERAPRRATAPEIGPREALAQQRA